MHRLLKIDRIEDLDPVLCPDKCVSDLYQGRTFRVSQNVGTVKLKQVGLDPETGLAAAGSADDQDVLVSGVGRILRPVAHHEPFRPCQDHVVLKYRIHERLDILRTSPAGRPVLHVMLIILLILAFEEDRQP